MTPATPREAVVDDDRTVAIGDPLVVRDGGAKGGWQVTYHGQARSYCISGLRWLAGQTRVVNDMAIVTRARRTAHFQVLPPKTTVTLGRVLKIYKTDHARSVLDRWGFEMPYEDYDALDESPFVYEFVVVSPSGALCGVSQDEVRQPGESDLRELAEAELGEISAGRVPYRGKLKLIGRGKWGRGRELDEVDS